MQRKLILGATGFIGGNLVRALVAKGEYPRIIVRPGSSLSFLEDILDRIEIVYGDFQDHALLPALTKNIDVVFHLISTTSPSSPMGSSLDDALSNSYNRSSRNIHSGSPSKMESPHQSS